MIAAPMWTSKTCLCQTFSQVPEDNYWVFDQSPIFSGLILNFLHHWSQVTSPGSWMQAASQALVADKPAAKSQLCLSIVCLGARFLSNSEPAFLFHERPKYTILVLMGIRLNNTREVLSRVPGLALSPKSSLKIPCHVSLDILLFVMLIFKMY